MVSSVLTLTPRPLARHPRRPFLPLPLPTVRRGRGAGGEGEGSPAHFFQQTFTLSNYILSPPGVKVSARGLRHFGPIEGIIVLEDVRKRKESFARG